MHRRTAYPLFVITLALLLSSCADVHRGWDNAMTEVGLYGPEQPDQGMVPTAHQNAIRQDTDAGKTGSWCRQYATSVAQDAAGDGYDAATQKHRYETAYRQCTDSPRTANTP
ncbi:MAG: hypothetical protein KGR48_03835 [Alphaproteobacteria bacterium]|nr:hypothetical protein [Alphaproteobacteria bacterium]MDE2012100.1 hypothetical protein [Alphaproteobacteria bacterium]MDE2072322.1 hypothetical protein [Alphaproteobacteria bacterium]MDE2350583.1 hypothetical protein [Alphaproteobacteria bacterium]